MKRQGSIRWALYGVLFAGLIACTKGGNKGDFYGFDPKESLRFNLVTEPPSLDWSKSTDTTSNEVQVNIMDGLVKYDLADPEMKLIPGLALSWESKNKFKTWIFKLRPGVKWTDGVELEAQHVIDGWERLLNPQTAAEYAYQLFTVVGAKEYNEGKNKDFSKVGIKAIDKLTLQIELDASKSFFPMLLTHHSTYPLRKDVVAKHGDKWTEPGNIQTLGAYKLTRWDHDKLLVLERNENYWGEKAKTKNIIAQIIHEQATAISLFDSGKTDALTQLPSSEIEKLRTRKEYHSANNLLMYYYGFNTKRAPMDNVLVRKAIAMAIDKNELAKILNGGQTPLNGWVPRGMFGYEEDVGNKFNPEKAKELLKEAGYSAAKPLPTITIGFNTHEDHRRVAENVQGQLKRNLGINVELRNEEWKVYLSSLRSDPPHMWRMGWLADYPDPDNYMQLMTSFSENNHTRWGSPEYDALVKAGISEGNKDKRREIYRKAQQILTNEATAVVPLYSGTSHFFLADRIKGFPINPMLVRDLTKVEVTQ